MPKTSTAFPLGDNHRSWGRYPKTRQQGIPIRWGHHRLPLEPEDDRRALPFGAGRSYGDSCLNDGGILLETRHLDRFVDFDEHTGVLRCEAGVLLSDILDLFVPRGWFLPVTPGTRFVTVGGAIANDVHGKNHHRAGTFGCHVPRFELLRSDGSRLLCSSQENPGWYNATIGGLGLTGLITWAELRLKPIPGPWIHQETIRYDNLQDFFSLSADSDTAFEYTVAWVDCQARGSSLGRGLFMGGNSCDEQHPAVERPSGLKLSVPLDPPISLINRFTLKAFNTAYYHRQRSPRRTTRVYYEPFFYPLDSISNWNRIYGPRGFLQYQCVIPQSNGPGAIKEMLKRISARGAGSFLAVLKMFGAKPSPGLLSFPRPGVTLALDFPNQGEKTLQLLDYLDEVVVAGAGAVYPAKDARMSRKSFQHYYPQHEKMQKYLDPRFSSSFWRRVTQP
ncbi:MAG: FAD-binding oxidoreductase [Gammaproteobacteria bacterium]|nr:FAD-binding oxidoreductase [Gammaproteobacteria bacterium]